MKKMFMLGLFALVACSLQAVTITWSSSQIKGGGNNGGYCGIAVVAGSVVDTQKSWEIVSWISSSDNSNSHWTTNQYLQNTSGSPKLLHQAVVGVNGEIYAQIKENGKNFSDSFTVTKDAIDGTFAIVLFNKWSQSYSAMNVTLNGWNTLADDASIDIGDVGELQWTGTSANVENATVASMTVDVPEPTVLALLAMGVAGLALRRKQA